MISQGDPVIPNMNFRLLMDGTEIPCKSIHGFRQETEEEYISEGGLNGYVLHDDTLVLFLFKLEFTHKNFRHMF